MSPATDLLLRDKLNQFFKAAFTVDNVIFGFDDGELKVLLIRRNEPPFEGYWALPGYFVRPDEDLDGAAGRVLKELAGLENVFLEQVGAFGTVDRHDFGRVITVGYFSLVRIENVVPRAAGVADDIKWHKVSELGKLAFDHDEILQAALKQLRLNVRTRPIGFELLPKKFTLSDLQHLYEAIWETDLEKRNFRKKIISMGILKDLNQLQEGVAHRPARLYSFEQQRYRELMRDGFSFEIKENRKSSSAE